MPIKYGMNFPAWFSPDHLPAPPEKPQKPEPFIVEKKDLLVKEIYFHGLSVVALMEMLSPFNYKEYIILQNDEFIGVYQIIENKIYLEEKDYNKKLKDYERNLKQYEAFYSEYQMRLRKYDDILSRYRDNEYRSKIEQLEEEIIEKQLEHSMVSNELEQMKEEIKTLSEKLKALNE